MRTPKTYSILAGALYGFLLAIASFSTAFAWNPANNWEDSYAVDGQCYCSSSNYDHDLDTKSAPTPLGEKNVVTICNDLEAALGDGSSSGRIPYNDIQCGNGPVNNASDETGCPGRVDQGSSGCEVIGPRWNLEAVYGPWPESCTASRPLQADQWYMFSLPCDVELPDKASVQEVLADDLGIATLGDQWTIFEMLADGSYKELSLNDELRMGVGYWLITAESGKVVDVVGEYPTEVDVPLNADSTSGAWTLIGSPFQLPVSWNDVAVVDMQRGEVQGLSSISPSNEPCLASPLDSDCVIANVAYKWTESETYEELNLSSGTLDVFEGAWVFAGQDGYRIRLPTP